MEAVRRYYSREQTDSQWLLRLWRSAALLVAVIEGFLLVYHVVALIQSSRHGESMGNPLFVTSGCAVAELFLVLGIVLCRCGDLFLLLHLILYQAALTVINLSLLVSILISLLYYREYFIHALEDYLNDSRSKESVSALLLTESLFLLVWLLYRALASVCVYRYWKSRRDYRMLMSSYESVDMHSTIYY